MSKMNATEKKLREADKFLRQHFKKPSPEYESRIRQLMRRAQQRSKP